MDSELTRKPIVTMAVIILKSAMICEGAIAKEGTVGNMIPTPGLYRLERALPPKGWCGKTGYRKAVDLGRGTNP